jgi:mannose-6-phosphate isomerase class I
MYDKFPFVPAGRADECSVGWQQVANRITSLLDSQPKSKPVVLCVECYPGVFLHEVQTQLSSRLRISDTILTEDLLLSPAAIEERLAPYLTDDPVFGRMNLLEVADFFDPAKLSAAQTRVSKHTSGTLLLLGTGASLLCEHPTLLIYADLARWEIQLRQRRNEIGNFGADNLYERPSLKYKRAFFVDWRAADRLKRRLFPVFDFLLDTNQPGSPKMISRSAFEGGMRQCVQQPFRVVPFFDPGPWGGHWMEKVCDLPDDGAPNHAWCFDCVPEENSLLLGFGDARVEVPAIDLVFSHPRELLGENVYARFGAEFPIRFDFLDTMGGGNLSLQVHPLTSYIREKFGMDYTQDESYYLLDAAPGASVYLGLKDGIRPEEMLHDLDHAQNGRGSTFPAEKYVNRFPAKKHDHFLIPAGTVHCSGKDSMVLEISATPYIFTFKLWDWGRVGLDGTPRPIHLDHGAANIQWDRTTEWVQRSLIHRIEPVAEGDGWREERTGLHELEFIETRRHWFTGVVPHHTNGNLHVLNLIEGEEVIVESPTQAFAPFIVHYAETFIVPAAVGAYTIRPYGPSRGKECATILAYVRYKG